MKTVTKKYPKYIATTMVVGDSQCKHLFHHFDPGRKGTPAFISQSGATIEDLPLLMDLVPQTVTTLILHVGTNDIARSSAEAAFERYGKLLESIRHLRPNVRTIYATLVLPRSQNRRRRNSNHQLVTRCNREASKFNSLLRRHCRQTKGTFYLDHELEWLSPVRVLAADGLHPSFEGVAVMASHLQRIVLRDQRRAPPTWLDEPVTTPTAPTEPAPQRPPPPPSAVAETVQTGATRKQQRNRSHRSTDTTGEPAPQQLPPPPPPPPVDAAQTGAVSRYNLRRPYTDVVQGKQTE